MDQLFDLPPADTRPEPPSGRVKPRLQRPRLGRVVLRPTDLESLLLPHPRDREVGAFLEALDLAA